MSTANTQKGLEHSWVVGWCVILAAITFNGCSTHAPDTRGTLDVHIDLVPHGLPSGFFASDADSRCAGQIIGYRFVIWLDDENVAVGFNTSPNCRESPDRRVDGLARVLVFNLRGTLEAQRDIAYPADGYGELVGKGEATRGPDGTLLFRMQSVNLDREGRHESPSTVLLLDKHLRDVAHLNRFLEQTTFATHALVFQDGFTTSGPREYSIYRSFRPEAAISRRRENWPTGTMDKKFGEQGVVYALCQQELRPNEYVSSNVVYSGAAKRCTLFVESNDGKGWSVPMQPNNDVSIIGFLADGCVVGQVRSPQLKGGDLVVWKQNKAAESLPWIPKDHCGSVQSGTPDMSRYLVFASTCGDESRRMLVFDQESKAPVVDTAIAHNARADLSPNGSHYATFDSGQLRVYSVPQGSPKR